MGSEPGLDADGTMDASMPFLTHVAEFVTLAHAGHSARRPRRDSVVTWWDTFDRVASAGAGRSEEGGYHFVVFLTSPSMVCLECVLGCLGAGCVLVPVNVRWSLDEMVSALGGLVLDDLRAFFRPRGTLWAATAAQAVAKPAACAL